MHPILLHLGPLTLRTYGALVALAFLAALQMAKAAAHTRGLSEQLLMDAVVVLVISGIVGARLFYVFLNLNYFVQHPWEIIQVWQGGLVFYGGFIVAAKSRSANPTIERSCGTFIPNSAAAWLTNAASWSVTAKTAVGRRSSVSSCRATSTPLLP